ncbi:helix-turn-helix domain-containing protein [Amycolatopsis cihanbeyliensis]|uniref:Helix-turn-helix protein n=1 Tax=Amycolatopsis cihanbeyliensis TaxID=1128664 RepID=A0A542DNB5_AMYCI|nr:helix-turn-helix transcriptional regulator [Amycolatopsis cihanbeyliensis]TQJ04580.1 helix-turn-helix protein [Amycolatopsis cihanbeyliensis]
MGKMRKPGAQARRLARTLRGLREEIGMTQYEAAKRLPFSHAKLSRIETGQVPEYHAFRAMLDVYGVPVTEWNEYLDIRERALEKDWWHEYEGEGRGYIAVEDMANSIRAFEFGYVPGLLQTEEYMREVFISASSPLTGEALENIVAARLRRQRRLTGEPVLCLHVIMDETALRPRVCTGAAHREQLRTILERAALPNVTVQVILEAEGAHDGLVGNLTLARYPGAEVKDRVYVEHLLGAVHTESEAQVRTAERIFGDLVDRALDHEDSITLIERCVVG